MNLIGQILTFVIGEFSLTFPLFVLIVKYASDPGTGALRCFGEKGLVDFSPFFGGDNLAGAVVFFTSVTRVVVPTDRETDVTGLLVTETAGRCFQVTGSGPTHDTYVCVEIDVLWVGALTAPAKSITLCPGVC